MAFRCVSGWTSERVQGALVSQHLIQAWGWARVGGRRRGSEHQCQQPSTGPGLPVSSDCPTGSNRLGTPATHSRQPDSCRPEPPTCVPTSEQQRETPATRAETWHPNISREPRDTPSTVFPGPVVAAHRWRRQEGKLSPGERGGAMVRALHSDIPGSTPGSHQVVTKCFLLCKGPDHSPHPDPHSSVHPAPGGGGAWNSFQRNPSRPTVLNQSSLDPSDSPGLRAAAGESNGTHSSTLAWKIPWTEEPGGLQSTGSYESNMTE